MDEFGATTTAIFLLPVRAEVISVTAYRRCCTSNARRSLGDRLRVVWKVGRHRIIVLPVPEVVFSVQTVNDRPLKSTEVE